MHNREEKATHVTTSKVNKIGAEQSYQVPESRRNWSSPNSPNDCQLLKIDGSMLQEGKADDDSRQKTGKNNVTEVCFTMWAMTLFSVGWGIGYCQRC